jgi:phage I-like protein
MNETVVERLVERRALRSAVLAGESVPMRVLLTPWGEVESTNGDFVVDAESGQMATAAFAEHGTDLPIDYEHQTLGGAYAAPNGQAPAAGWIKSIAASPGVGLVAEIEWTQLASEQLLSRQYRYLSPVAVIRKDDRKLVAIHSAALTNKPAIVGMPAIVNRESMATTATTARAVHGARGEEASAEGEEVEALAMLRRDLRLDDGAEMERVLLTARERICRLEEQLAGREADELIDGAVREGKLAAAQRAWAARLIQLNRELFEEWRRSAPVVVARGVLVKPRAESWEHRTESAAARAKAEYRANPALAAITTEDAFVADSVKRPNV